MTIDTDWASDVDDAVAIRVADWAVRHGQIKLAAVMLNTTQTASPGSLQSLMANDGVTGVAIGTSHTSNPSSGPYQTDLRSLGISNGYITGNESYADSVAIYRRVLAGAAAPVDMVSIGSLNNLADLLQSPADATSPLTGLQLVTAKVHRLWVMGGQYPNGTEFNFSNNALAIASAVYVTTNWPTPIVYSGFEMGNTVLTGASVAGRQPGDLLAQALVDYGSTTRSSWDPMNTLVAIGQDPDSSGYTSVWGSNAVNATTGANTFTPSAVGRDRYLVKQASDATFQSRINTIIDKTTW